VGVVIEEDCKTEEEFIEEIVYMNDELNKLNKEAKELEDVINQNIAQITEN
jgi:type I restriction enzyme M protein